MRRQSAARGDVTVHGVFTNLAVDFRAANRRLDVVRRRWRWRAAHGHRLLQSVEAQRVTPNRITTFEDTALRAKLAGTTTLGAALLDDTGFSVQILGGMDYSVADRIHDWWQDTLRGGPWRRFEVNCARVGPTPQSRIHSGSRLPHPVHGRDA